MMSITPTQRGALMKADGAEHRADNDIYFFSEKDGQVTKEEAQAYRDYLSSAPQIYASTISVLEGLLNDSCVSWPILLSEQPGFDKLKDGPQKQLALRADGNSDGTVTQEEFTSQHRNQLQELDMYQAPSEFKEQYLKTANNVAAALGLKVLK